MIGDARELKNFGEHSPNIYIYIFIYNHLYLTFIKYNCIHIVAPI